MFDASRLARRTLDFSLIAVFVTLLWPLESVRAEFERGWQAYKRGDYAAAMEEWRKDADTGDPRAQYNLGYMFYEGQGVPQSKRRAIGLWMKAAEQGVAQAQHNLALSYLSGDLGTKDAKAALFWIEKSVQSGLARSQYTLGKMYLHGIGVEQNQEKSSRPHPCCG